MKTLAAKSVLLSFILLLCGCNFVTNNAFWRPEDTREFHGMPDKIVVHVFSHDTAAKRLTFYNNKAALQSELNRLTESKLILKGEGDALLENWDKSIITDRNFTIEKMQDKNGICYQITDIHNEAIEKSLLGWKISLVETYSSGRYIASLYGYNKCLSSKDKS